jgi:hypothetical protein
VARRREIKGSHAPKTETVRWLFKGGEFIYWDGRAAAKGHASFELTGAFPITKLDARFSEFVIDTLPSEELEEESGSDQGIVPAIDLDLTCVLADGLVQSGDRSRTAMFTLIRGRRLKTRPYDGPSVPCHFVTPVSHRTEQEPLTNLSAAIEAGMRDSLVRLLAGLDPRISGLEILSPEGQWTVVKLKLENLGFVPLATTGDGVRRTLTLASALVASSNGILLVDEIETALHVGVLQKVFRFLAQECVEKNVQFFATTHSLEAVDGVINAMNDRIDDLVVYRLPGKSGDTNARRYPGALARELRREDGLDLR